MVRRSDTMLLEGWLRSVSRLRFQIRDPYPSLNTPHDDPVLVTYGSNSVTCDRQDLEPLVDAMEDEETTANSFLRDTWTPWLREHADRDR